MIKPGDLVMVVKRRECCGTGTVGAVFKVIDTRISAILKCSLCGNTRADVPTVESSPNRFTEIARLKKIDPLNELEEETQTPIVNTIE